jgi:hypothetical protein
MKLFVGLLSLALSFASIASSGETKTFNYDGSQNSVELMLKGEKTHTEYRYESRQTICYRTVTVYRTVCTGGGPRGPRNPGPPRQCYTQPYYTQQAYSCIQQVQIPYEVKDYDVDAKIIVDVTNLTGLTTTGEKISVTLNGDTVSISTVGSKAFFLVLKKQDLRGNMSGSVKFIDGLYAIELVEASPVLKALKMTNISLNKSVLNFDLGPVANRANIGLSLNVTHKRTLASDVTLFDRELNNSEVVINATSAGSAADVNVENLGIKLDDGKYSLTAKAFFKAAGTVLNKAQFGDALAVSRTLIYKIR